MTNNGEEPVYSEEVNHILGRKSGFFIRQGIGLIFLLVLLLLFLTREIRLPDTYRADVMIRAVSSASGAITAELFLDPVNLKKPKIKQLIVFPALNAGGQIETISAPAYRDGRFFILATILPDADSRMLNTGTSGRLTAARITQGDRTLFERLFKYALKPVQ